MRVRITVMSTNVTTRPENSGDIRCMTEEHGNNLKRKGNDEKAKEELPNSTTENGHIQFEELPKFRE